MLRHRTIAFTLLAAAGLGIAGGAEAQQAPPGTFDAIRNLCLALAFGQQPSGPREEPPLVLTGEQRDLFRRCSEIVGSGGRDPDSLVAVAREELAAIGSALTESAAGQLQNVQSRVLALHRGARGLSVAGLTLDAPGPTSTGVLLAAAGDDVGPYLSYDAQEGGDGGGDPFGERWGLFVTGHYTTGDHDATTLEPGYDFDGHDVTLGLDRRVGGGFFGLAGGFRSAQSDLHASDLTPAAGEGELDVDGTSLSLYAGTGWGDAWLLDGTVSFTRDDFESRTPVRYDIAGHPVSQLAVAETEGDELVASVGIGYDRPSGGFSFQPALRVTYTDAQIDGYTEQFVTGPGSAIDPVTGQPFGHGMELTVDEQSIESLISTLGATLAWNVGTGWGVLIPQLRAHWNHEFEDDARAIVTRFAATPSNIAELLPLVPGGPTDPAAVNLTVFTNQPDRDYFDVGAGLQAVLRGGTQLFVLVESVVGLEDVSSFGGTAGVRFAF
ncbi:MAG TPA: autotransporter outer membrane beta-barrel domain-containing protein [Thermoanaerobaculia bacterium]|nr:autotransporter outer membrane beta-barrel domain-containing protein [Thermoanaerobaculia bacterium]